MKIYKDIIQKTPEWEQLRAGVITGTKLEGVLGGPKAQETAIFNLIGEEFAPIEPTFQNQAMQRGIELEPIAKARYMELTGEIVEEIGFCKSETYVDEFGEWLGLSPDGLIMKDGKYKKGIEIKCPGGKNHVKYIIENCLPSDYKHQILNYFLVNEELEELDFISYHPDFYVSHKQIHIINIKREEIEKELEKAKEKLLDFRKKWLEKINIIIK